MNLNLLTSYCLVIGADPILCLCSLFLPFLSALIYQNGDDYNQGTAKDRCKYYPGDHVAGEGFLIITLAVEVSVNDAGFISLFPWGAI
jgi:hypothetical protein